MATKSKNIYATASSKYYYNLSITATEQTVTDEHKEKNVSRVKVTGTLTSEGISFSGDSVQKLAIYWFDDYKNIDGTQLSTFSFTDIDLDGDQKLTITKEIPHKPDGSLSGYAKVVFTKSGTSSYVPPTTEVKTTNFALTNIPRATTPVLSSEECTLGETITITLDRAVESFTHDLYYKVGTSATTRFGDNVGTSMDWEVPLSLANWITENPSGTVSIICDTYNGETLIGSKTVNLDVNVPSSITPKITSFEVSEATEGIAEKFGVYVKNKSTVRVKASAEGSYSSTIKSYSASVNGISYSGDDITSGVLDKAGIITVSASATDSRGRVASQGKTISVLDYYAPKITNFTAQRCTSDGTLVNDDTGKYLKINLNYDIAPVNNKNDKRVAVEYRVQGTDDWTQLLIYTDAYNGGTGREIITTTVFDVDKTYELRVVATDYFTTAENPQVMMVTVDPSYTLINYHESGKTIAFGTVATEEDCFECDLSKTILRNATIKGNLNIADKEGKNLIHIKDLIIDISYPVGSYYETSDTSFDPNVNWHGTWVLDSAGRVTVAQDTGQDEFKTVGNTGGEAKHTLTIDEMPSHSHSTQLKADKQAGGSGTYFSRYVSGATNQGTLKVGGDQPHNNMPPYIVVKRWHRTA